MDVWNLIDWLSIAVGFAVAVYWASLMNQSFDVSARIVGLGPSPPSSWDVMDFTDRISMRATDEPYEESLHGLLSTLGTVQSMASWQRLGLFWYTMIILLRFIKGFRGQPRVALIAKTLSVAAVDLAHYLIIFFAVFFSFSLGGHVLFGPYLEEWSSAVLAINSACRMLMGDLDYNRLHDVQPMIAAAWFWSYVIFVVFVILNLLVAILVDTYAEVKLGSGSVGSSVFKQVAEAWDDTLWSFGFEGMKRNPTVDDLLVIMDEKVNPTLQEGDVVDKKSRDADAIARGAVKVTLEELKGLGCSEAYGERILQKCLVKSVRKFELPRDPTLLMLTKATKAFESFMLRFEAYDVKTKAATMDILQGVENVRDMQKSAAAIAARLRVEMRMPRQWELQNDDGTEYFLNTETGQTAWRMPKEHACAAKLAKVIAKRNMQRAAAGMLIVTRFRNAKKRANQRITLRLEAPPAPPASLPALLPEAD